MVNLADSSDIKPTDRVLQSDVISSATTVDPSTVVVEHADEKKPDAKLDPLSEIRSQLEAAEKSRKEETEKRVAAERERDVARTQATDMRSNLNKSETDKVAAQETSINDRLEKARLAVESAERELEEAIDAGKSAKDQISLQKKLAEAVYTAKGAEGTKNHFDNWKKKQIEAPQQAQTQQQGDDLTPAARKWVDAHPEFNTNPRFYRTATGAHMEALKLGMKADTREYFDHIDNTLRDEGMLDDSSSQVTAQESKPATRKSTPAAPASHSSAGAGANGGNAAQASRTGSRVFKLDSEMRNMAHKIYGKGTKFNLSNDEAEKRYAAKQIEIREKRANGENI